MTNANKELRTNFILHIFAIMLGILLSVGAAKAETFTVTNTNDMGTGSLRQAIVAANAAATDDTIVFNIPTTDSGYSAAADSYTITLGSGQLTIANNGKLVINGLGAERLSVSGNNLSRVILINENAAVTISGITVTGGLEGEEFVGVGGGIYNGGSLTLTNSTISGNRASERGGGIFNRSVGTLNMSNSTVAGNRSRFGSGIYNDGAQTLISSTVSGNGVCTLGCGIYNLGSMTLTNSTISGNGQALYGGGILNGGTGTATLRNSTVSGNTAFEGGGGIRNSGTLSVSDSIIANSGDAGDCANLGEGTVSAGNSLIQGGTGCVNGTNSNNLTGDPMLGPLQDNGGPTLTHALLAGSPAINSGSNALIPAGVATDQRGGVRIVGSTVDMGAVESGAAVFTVNSTADTTPGTGTCELLTATTNCTLREAMEAADAAATDDTIVFNIPTSDAGYSATTDRYTVTLGGHELQIGGSGRLSINGLGAKRLTVSGNNQSRVIRAGTSAAVFKIDGITITGGNGVGNNNAFGGGVYNLGNMTLSNSVVSDNTAAAYGGGIYTHNGTVLLVNTTVSGNSADQDGGGISTSNGTALLVNTTVSGNSADEDGGGISKYNTTMTILNSTISSNSASRGDGIDMSFSTLNIRNSIIANTGSLRCHGITLNAEYSLIEGGSGCVNGTNSNNETGYLMLLLTG